ncbi:SdiA-regulated domain-containing protein [Hufsiella ginkgonis]|uniref:Uncharacterized protein n=1 Tax=Hufsiella ginkgonis TaxID=2695274 RepID=A0A7K1Y3T3_9SPHI|nr:SdiA-regulated domain-containing protein [Hufsiella ginkgonis]MXV17709.1 hypothetical protein [Hufsiella ginkgonis]
MNRVLSFLLVVLGISLVCGCIRKKKDDSKHEKSHKNEDKKELVNTIFTMPKELKEISGIVFEDSTVVLAINDEEGYLYRYDIRKEAIVSRLKFAGPADYEDVALVGSDVYIVTSKGSLYHIKDYRSKAFKVYKFNTPLKEKNNIEGLAYDKRNNRLLLASKDEGMDNDKDKEVFAFSLATRTLNTKPVYSIRLADIEAFFKGDAIEETSKKFLKAIGNQNLSEVVRPSAIAVHPGTGNLYVLSSINNFIAIINPQGKMIDAIQLKGKEFSQPEGLAFSPAGKLYVSNEGKNWSGNIIQLDYED